MATLCRIIHGIVLSGLTAADGCIAPKAAWGAMLLFAFPLVAVVLAIMIGKKRRRFSTLPFAWDLACIVAGVVVLMCPLWMNHHADRGPHGETTYVFVMDCSRSMLADDHGMTRLQRAKDIAREMVKSLESGRLAIVSFAGSSFLDLPPTDDRAAFLDALEELKPSMEDLPGSDPAAALQFSETVAAMSDDGPAIAILLSDGEIQGGETDYWEARSIPLVWRCVGLGAPQPIPLGQVWMRDPDTGETALTQATSEKIDVFAALSSAPFSHTLDGMEALQEVGGEASSITLFCMVGAVLFLMALRTPSPRVLISLLLATAWSVHASPLDGTAAEKRTQAEKIRNELAELPLKSPRRAVLLANWAALIADESPDDAVLLTQEALRLVPQSVPIRRNLEILEKRRRSANRPQNDMVTKQEKASLEELLSLPTEREREEGKPSSNPTVSIPSTPGTWREIKRQNRFIKPRTVKAKPW